MVKIICPKCNHTDFHAHGTVSATLHIMDSEKDTIEINFLGWNEILEIEHYICISCNHRFLNNE